MPPGHRPDDACAIDLTTTVVAGRRHAHPRDVHGESEGADRLLLRLSDGLDRPAPNSDMAIGPEEQNVVRQQFARFGSQCRPFAPMYRQVTLAGAARGHGRRRPC